MPVEVGDEDRPRLPFSNPEFPENYLELQTQMINPAYERFEELTRDLVLSDLTTREISFLVDLERLIRLLFILDAQAAEVSYEEHPYQPAIDYFLGMFATIVSASRAKGGFTARNLRTSRLEEHVRSEELQKKQGWLQRILRR